MPEAEALDQPEHIRLDPAVQLGQSAAVTSTTAVVMEVASWRASGLPSALIASAGFRVVAQR